jgi:hypothetical protein
MEWTLRLVGTGMDGQYRSVDVMQISRPDGLGDVANLGLTLAEAKRLLAKFSRRSSPHRSATTRCCGRTVSHVAEGAT